MNSQLYAAFRHTGLVRPLATPDEPEGGINGLVFAKGNERFIFLWRDKYQDAVMNVLGRFADDPGLSFDWADAGSVTAQVRSCGRRGER